MKIAVGSDHAGFPLKKHLLALLEEWGHSIADKGAFDETPSDYPDTAHAVARAVADGDADRGLVVCGSGVGACVVANKVPGVRAACIADTYSAAQGVEHDDLNVLALGARVTGSALAEAILKAFLEARFSGEERHSRRLAKLLDVERTYIQDRT